MTPPDRRAPGRVMLAGAPGGGAGGVVGYEGAGVAMTEAADVVPAAVRVVAAAAATEGKVELEGSALGAVVGGRGFGARGRGAGTGLTILITGFFGSFGRGLGTGFAGGGFGVGTLPTVWQPAQTAE
jgi:hypothetical protein